MTPEDVLLEAMTAALAHGGDPDLRPRMCRKLRESIERESNWLRDGPVFYEDATALPE